MICRKRMFRFIAFGLAYCFAQILGSTQVGSEICSAAARGDTTRVAQLLAKGAAVNTKDNEGSTPLHWAASGGHKEVIELLLSKGANVNAKNNIGWTALCKAAGQGHTEVVKLLLSKGADVSYPNGTPLDEAAWGGHKEVAELLLSKGADVNVSDFIGNTPLHRAAEKGHKEVAELLLSKGANVNARNYEGETPLLAAANEGHKEVVELLLSKGADVNAKDNIGWTALSKAADKGHKEVVELLLSKGADIKAEDNYGCTPLHRAAQGGSKQVVELLLSKGADLNVKTNDGGTPLYSAVNGFHKDVAELLLSKGADVNAKKNDGMTPLLWAALMNHKDLVQLLLACRADYNSKDNQGRTPLDLITDQNILIGILMKESDPVVCEDIIDRLDKPRAEAQLSRLARDPNPSMRAIAIDCLLNLSILNEIAQKDADLGLRSAAARQMEHLGRCGKVLSVIEKGGKWFGRLSLQKDSKDYSKRVEEMLVVVSTGLRAGSQIEIQSTAVGISAPTEVMDDLDKEDMDFVLIRLIDHPSIRKLWFRFLSAAMEQKKVMAMVAYFTVEGALEGKNVSATIQMQLSPEAVRKLSVR